MIRMASNLLYIQRQIGGVHMKKVSIIIGILMALAIQLRAQSDTLRLNNPADDTDSVEYELIVLDPGYDAFLATQPPMEFHSLQYYEHWNARYVMEWNLRHSQPLYYGDLYETYIDYREDVDYGLELNYKLYYYFRFFEQENGVDLLMEKVF